MSDQLVGYYSEFWHDLIPLSQVENIDPTKGGVGDQHHKQMRVTYHGMEDDMSYEQFAKEWQPVYLKGRHHV